MSKKPVLLLDVDGVLNVIDKTCENREVRFERAPGIFLPFYPTKNAKTLLELAWSSFDVYWLTAWRNGAHLISRWAGLEDRPVLYANEGDDWKVTAIKNVMSELESRKVAWIEDGISAEAKVLVAEKGWTYFHTDPFVGVTEEDLKALKAFAD